MSDRRAELMRGELSFPPQIRSIINPSNNPSLDDLITGFWDNLYHNFLREKSCNTLIWLIKFNNQDKFNQMLMHLSKAGWITSSVENHYAFIELNESKLLKWITKEELISLKFQYKTAKYRLTCSKSTLDRTVQINGKHQETGLVRKGFMKAGNNRFKYDTEYLKKYIYPISRNIEKGLTNSTKDITYQEIIEELLEYYSLVDNKYTPGNCYIDSRGRAIYQCTKKVFNPISVKDARAMVIIPNAEYLTDDGLKEVYASVAQLNGYRGKNFQDKWEAGREFYLLRKTPSLEVMDLFQDWDDLHVKIWLERIYNALDKVDDEPWDVAIELDCQNSLMQYFAVLLNDWEYMRGTNMLETKDGFQDMYETDYCSREHIKKVVTPHCYGSGRHPRELLDHNKLEYTPEQLRKIGAEISIGKFANACQFKDYIINNVEPKVRNHVNINGEKFYVECNRFKWEETKQSIYSVYTSQQGICKKVVKQSHLVPDLEQFKRYWVTCLIHNLDSQVANQIALNLDWCLPIHDAFLHHPNHSKELRQLYTSQMYSLWKNRRKILRDYFDSIGILDDWKEKPWKGPNIEIKEFSPYCLK